MASFSRLPLTVSLLAFFVVVVVVMVLTQTSAVKLPRADPAYQPLLYEGKKYYIHAVRFTDVLTAAQSCKAEDAMLAEFNSKAEYLAIRNYLSSIFPAYDSIYHPQVPYVNDIIYHIVFGGTIGIVHDSGKFLGYKGKEWVLLSTNVSLPYTDWAQGHPINDENLRCVSLSYDKDWQMTSGLCREWYLYGQIGYMCEKDDAPSDRAFLMSTADRSYRPLHYQGNVYYIHKNYFSDYQAALDDCTADDGKLAEVNHQDEYNAIHNYLKTTEFVFVYLGGTDANKDGEWVLPSTGQPLPYTDWWNGVPFSGDDFNCLCLWSATDYKMFSYVCINRSPGRIMRFLCEKPCVMPEISNDPKYPPLLYQGAEYYLYSDLYANMQLAMDSCAADGGVVVELSDEAEFTAVLNYLKSTYNTTIDYIWLGTIYKNNMTWILPASPDDSPFLFWGVWEEPERMLRDFRYRCVNIITWEWTMYTADCKFKPRSGWRFMCERKTDICD